MTKKHALQGTDRRRAIAAYVRQYREESGADPTRAAIARALGIPDSGALGRMIDRMRSAGEIVLTPIRRSLIEDGHGGLLVERLDDKGTVVIHQNPDGDGNSIVIPVECYREIMTALQRLSPFRQSN